MVGDGTDQPDNQPAGSGNDANTMSLMDAVRQIYRTALGRDPENDQVVMQWIQGTGGDLAKIQQGIYATPEAKAYGARNAQPAQPGPDAPKPPPPPPGQGPAPVAPPPTAAGAPPPNAAPGPMVSPYPTAPAFTYADFVPPNPNDLLNDPGYKFEYGQGMQAIGAKNAALGTLNTGGTIKDFESFGQNLAATRGADLFNRKLTEYQQNRGNALDTYNTNYGTQYRDPWQANFQTAGLNQNNNQFNASLGQNNSQFNSSLDWQKFLQNYKATITDPFSQKYSLLGLL